jgi:hypothetical protein
MNTLRKEIANDLHRNAGGERGAGGHIRRRHEISESSRQKENEKRVTSGRNKVNKAMRVQIATDFKSEQGFVKCIFCGKRITNIDNLSPERMKPGPIGGKYERGNMAPAHEACNTKVGTMAQYQPDEYYDLMMKKFLQQYKQEINNGKLKFVFSKNRKKLGAAPR